MLSPKAFHLSMVSFVWAVPLAAQDITAGSAARALELPAHRALHTVMINEDTRLAPFSTDGCSGGLSEVWGLVADTFPDFADAYSQVPPWEGCCVTHDVAYHAASYATDAEAGFNARLAADQKLRECVIETGESSVSDLPAKDDTSPDQIRTAYATIAGAMYMAVRFGGAPCSGLPWRWGYGYEQCSVLTGVFD